MRGKLRRRISPKKKDMHDCLMTVLETEFSHEEVMRMTASQRKSAREKAKASGPSPRDDLVPIWRAWQDASPPKCKTWLEHLTSINRMDLYRDLGIHSEIYKEKK